MIQKKIKRPKQPKLSTLQAKADAVTSTYIRQKYSDHAGYVKCVTCDTVLPWKDSHCAHYIERGHIPTRYIEENLHPACPSCNVFRKEYHKRQYTLYMIDMYGRDKIDELTVESKRLLTSSQKRQIFEDAIDYYSQKLKEMA